LRDQIKCTITLTYLLSSALLLLTTTHKLTLDRVSQSFDRPDPRKIPHRSPTMPVSDDAAVVTITML
jgi:hypothetical protein